METPRSTPSNVTPLRGDSVAPRIPPHNYEAEQALLGAILANNLVFDRVNEFLRPEHFADAVHGRIYEACGKLIQRGQIANVLTLKNLFDQDAALADVGGAQYLARLAASVVTIINAEDYGHTVHDLFLRRQLIDLGEEVVNESFTHDIDITALDLVEKAEQQLYQLAETGQTEGGPRPLSESLAVAITMAEAAYKRDSHVTGVTTGLDELDRRLGGLHPSDLVILAGRPSMGKAQPLNAPVLTPSGWRAIGEMRPGDELASVDGERNHVVGVFPQGVKQIFRVTMSDGRSAECCAEHLWRVHYRDWPSPRVLSTTEIAKLLSRERYRHRLWIDTHEGAFGHEDPLPIDPWLLGALLGDGNLTETTPRLSTASPEILRAVSAALGGNMIVVAAGGYDYRLRQNADHRRSGRQGVWPNPLKEALRGLVLWGLKSEDKFIPDLYLTAARSSRLALLRGLLDTDGWVERWGTVRFSTASERLARGVAELVRSIGGWCRISRKQPSYVTDGERRIALPAYVCTIHVEHPKELFTLPEKRDRAPESYCRRRRPVILSVEPTREAEARCIAVSHPSRLYITSEHVVTHNTALATNIAFNAAKAYREEVDATGQVRVIEGAKVAFFSLEMSAEQLATRILAEQTGISGDRIRRGDVREDDFPKFVAAAQELQRLPFFIDDTPAITVSALRTRARRLKRQHGLGLIVVDYLQLMRPTAGMRPESRVQEVSDITRGLKAIAKELDLPVMALSQLSRAVEQREDKRPQLSDLRESGSIEQDADVVMFVYREQYYHERSEPKQRPDEAEDKYHERYARWQERGAKIHNVAEVNVAKQRHGPVGTAELYFDGTVTKFGNLARDDHLPDAHP
ncbi:MAG: replicative DNA helicase [Alphaproteobacteria bacterium]|nr:MAG: replicative DNA helicase [Alphaproteobacteria bacterium]